MEYLQYMKLFPSDKKSVYLPDVNKVLVVIMKVIIVTHYNAKVAE